MEVTECGSHSTGKNRNTEVGWLCPSSGLVAHKIIW